ncbi:MAG TPA: nitrate/nitrite transporter NrtS [Gammaproteobacteria bacterium]
MNSGKSEVWIAINRWCRAARRRDVAGRSTRVALIVGTILVAVNYTDRWLDGSLGQIDYVKMLLTYLVPYCVSTWVSVSTLHSSDNT